MAPSSQRQSRRTNPQVATRSIAFGRVTKANQSSTQPKACSKRNAVLEESLCGKVKLVSAPPRTGNNKRRFDELDSESSEVEGTTQAVKQVKKAKAQRHQLSTPPPSSPESTSFAAEHNLTTASSQDRELTDTLQQLISLHKSFLRALTIHYAHNGMLTPASLSTLIPSITRLWKKHAVQQEDIQRMLAMWEINQENFASRGEKEMPHRLGPFTLTCVGLGNNSQIMLELFRSSNSVTVSFDESEIQRRYERHVEQIWSAAVTVENSFLFETLQSFPLLITAVGEQTNAKQQKVSSIRNDILGQSLRSRPHPAQPDLSNLSLADPFEPKSVPQPVKSRTLSLFDRVRAKQLATSSSETSTPAAILRRRAVARISHVTDTLRMKQAQKVSVQFHPNIHGSPSRVQSSMKVSFSLDALVAEIRNSLPVPVPDEEIRECLYVLGREVPDTWCSIYEMGGVKCVTLQGEGKSGLDMKKYCERVFGI